MSDKILQPQRKQTSVTIEGIDTSTPDDLVKDGKCQELHNVRIKDGAWRPVNMHKILHDVASIMGEDFVAQYEIVYHHPAAGEGIYIASQEEGSEHRFYVVDLRKASVVLFATEQATSNVGICHFGNVLMINADNRTRKFLYTNDTYEEWTQPAAPVVTVEEGTKTPAWPTHLSSASYFDGPWVATNEVGVSSGYSSLWRIFDEMGNNVFPTNANQAPLSSDHWLGTLVFFASFRMKDGSIVSVSPLGLITSEQTVEDVANRSYQWVKTKINDSDCYGIVYYSSDKTSAAMGTFKQPQMHYFLPRLSIAIPENLPSLIESVAIFTTRIFPPFQHSKQIIGGSMFSSLVNTIANFRDINLAEEPFYLCKEIPLSEFKNGGYKLSLTYELLSDITTKRVYTPSNNIHEHSSDTMLDYNNRLHLANYTTAFHQPNELLPLFVTDGGEDVNVNREVIATLKINDSRYHAISRGLTGRNPDISFIDGYKSIISYPDHRCEELLIVQRQENLADPTFAIRKLTPAINNNFAYYIAPNTGKPLSHDTLRYTPISYSRNVLMHDISAPSRANFTNQVIVSPPNNPFAFDFANTYAIGSESSKILALQSAAIEMSDTKFGEMPLYAFTEEGIFALQAGESTLYSSVIPINYDKIINPDVLAINYSLVYITSKGVHILNGKGSTLISAPLNDLAGHPLTLLNEVKLLNPESFNEVVLYHEPSSKAYIYNLDFGYWSTRDMSGAVINDGKIVDDRYILDATEEEVQRTPAECKILTRPIKLGDLEFKRLETIIPRVSFLEKDATEFNFLVQGSNNPSVDWTALRCYHATFDKQGLYPIILRRTPFSSKYIRFALDATNKDGVGDFTIANVDFEFYHKFLRRMR